MNSGTDFRTDSHTDRPLSLDERVRVARARLFFGHAAGNMVSFNLGALVIGFVLHSGGTTLGMLAVWYGAILVLSLLITVFESRVARHGLNIDNCARLIRIRIFLGALIASLYGVAVFIGPTQSTPQQDTFLFFIMTTIVTVAALGYSAIPRYFLMLDAVCLGPMTLFFAYAGIVRGDTYYLVLFIVSLLWQIVVIAKGLRAATSTLEAIVTTERLQDEIVEHTRTKAQIEHIAMHDPLTGVANRRHFEETSARMLKSAERRGIALGFIMIDLDDFKPINDSHGHAMGDAVLKRIADGLRESVRASDFVARIGGDEFALIIENIETPGALSDVAHKLAEINDAPFEIDGQSIRCAPSIGYAAFPQDGWTLDEIMRVADQRMYEQKRNRKAAPSA